MHLKKIKLVGFKSFVDPTDVPLPSNLVSVLGPNGCGKSNVIDAVRWVMGESSAKHLRGGSMADVIFNGCATRKPVSQAAVELVFDNVLGCLGGEYASYTELSLKRVVDKSGQSNYFLNGTRCRRKDITDIFLGTGLGPRSYAIIGQGDISKFVEAKPDEMRVYIEEAAGISRYKERRRETENRIRHTYENLERLADIRDELDKQLQRLYRQSKAAQRYKALKEEDHLLRAQICVLKWDKLNQNIIQRADQLTTVEVKLEAVIASQRHVEAQIEIHREAYISANDEFNEVQAQYYHLGADIARIEETLNHNKERTQQLENDLSEVSGQIEHQSNQLSQDKSLFEQLQKDITIAKPEVSRQQEIETELIEQIQIVEQAKSSWQSSWDDFNQTAAKTSETAQVQQTTIQHLEKQIHDLQARIVQADEEARSLNTYALSRVIEQTKEEIQSLEEHHEQTHKALSTVLDDILIRRDANDTLQAQLNQLHHEAQQAQGRFSSLEALQQAALGKQPGKAQVWLAQNNLADKARLAQNIQVLDADWANAVETVLGRYLQAVCVEGFPGFEKALTEFDSGDLCFVSENKSAPAHMMVSDSLLSKVTTSVSYVKQRLKTVFVAKDLSDAFARLPALKTGESIITKDGIWLGENWLRVHKEADPTAGVLQREQELKSLTITIKKLFERIETLKTDLKKGVLSLTVLENLREEHQGQLNDVSKKITDTQAQLRLQAGQLEHVEQRINDITREKITVTKKLQESETNLENAREIWQAAMSAMQMDVKRRDALVQEKEHLNSQFDMMRQKLTAHQHQFHQLQLSLQANENQVALLKDNQERASQSLQLLTQKKAALESALTHTRAPMEAMQSSLESKLQAHLDLEEKLQKSRSKLETLESKTRTLDEQRNQHEQAQRDTHFKLDEIRMANQADQVRMTTFEEQLLEMSLELNTLRDEIPSEANLADWENNLEALEQKIHRLGPINLAAIDEYETERERKTYLDQQYEDLTEALTTLKNAIRKIDQETRHRFKETFDLINTSFQQLFPKLFGGGRATLELTGQDLLDTGVVVIASPPGKRNSSVSLLSGGEKALVAIAIVFAIFQLNPSPFCMLDEVDAPLDDANVARFCALLKEMSETIQFIFITHNKVTMELADYLMGVTMREAGVSRIVSVNINEATGLVESSQ